MQIKAGFTLRYQCPQPTPMLLCLHVHPLRRADLLSEQILVFSRPVEAWDYLDGFGNSCTRIVAPAGELTISTEFWVFDTGLPDVVPAEAHQHAIEELPDETLVYLLGSRYCETDLLMPVAWELFGDTAPGWPRVQAILDWVHKHIRFDYGQADRTRSAYGAYQGRAGVCRDFAHLALTLCRCMNIPARYCTGYLGDIGVPPNPAPMDFSAWFEVYLGGHWYTADARHNTPRIGRVLMGIGRDATDVALSTQFGPGTLSGFEVVTEQVQPAV
jgi:transglutaminase-like putative cysteine protease